MPKVKRGAPRTGSRPHHGEQQAEHRHQQGRQRCSCRPGRSPRQRPATISAKNSAGPNFERQRGERHGDHAPAPTVASVPPTNEPMAAMPSAEPARPWRAIWWPSMQVTTERRLARHVDQHRGDGAAIHRAVVDRAQHDDGAGRIEAEGERDQDRRAGRRPEPGSTPISVPSMQPASAIEQILPVTGAAASPTSRWPSDVHRSRARTRRPAGARPARW